MSFFLERLDSCCLAPAARDPGRSVDGSNLPDRAAQILAGVSGEQIEWLLAELDQALADWLHDGHAAGQGETGDDGGLASVFAFVGQLISDDSDSRMNDQLLMPDEFHALSLALISLALLGQFEDRKPSLGPAVAGHATSRVGQGASPAGRLAIQAMERADALRARACL